MQALAASLAVEVRLWQVVDWLFAKKGVRSAVTAGRRGACCAKRVGQRAAQSGRKNGKPGFLPEVRFQGGALVRAADKGEPVG